MPIYEFFCSDCNTIFNFLARRVNTTKRPNCPKCTKELSKLMSKFATIGKAKEPDEAGMPDIDEGKMERVLGELASEAENINEEDPKSMAQLMRKFTQKTGLDLGEGMEEALSRMEAGEDPEKIEAEMGDLLDGDEMPFSLSARKGKGSHKAAPIIDEKLYDLEDN